MNNKNDSDFGNKIRKCFEAAWKSEVPQIKKQFKKFSFPHMTAIEFYFFL